MYLTFNKVRTIPQWVLTDTNTTYCPFILERLLTFMSSKELVKYYKIIRLKKNNTSINHTHGDNKDTYVNRVEMCDCILRYIRIQNTHA